MTDQQIFDKSVSGVRKQGDLAKNRNRPPPQIGENGLPSCASLTPDGRRCAVGQLLTSADPNALINLFGFVGCEAVDPFLHAEGLGVTRLLRALQYAHDESDSVEEFLTRAATVAREHNLDPAVAL